MQLDARFEIPAQTMARDLNGETVILDLASGTYYSLDPVGSRIWTLLDQGQSLADICQTLMAEYEVAEDQLTSDVVALATTLLDKRLVIRAA